MKIIGAYDYSKHRATRTAFPTVEVCIAYLQATNTLVQIKPVDGQPAIGNNQQCVHVYKSATDVIMMSPQVMSIYEEAHR